MANVDRVLIDDWYVVARIEDCPPNSIKSVRLLGEDLVLWRGSTSESPILAWQDRCPHRGTRLSLGKIVDDTFTCKYHDAIKPLLPIVDVLRSWELPTEFVEFVICTENIFKIVFRN